MIKASVPEKNQLFVSLLSPVIVKMDLPVVTSSGQSGDDGQGRGQENQGWIGEFVGDLSFRNIVSYSNIRSSRFDRIHNIHEDQKIKEPKKMKS